MNIKTFDLKKDLPTPKLIFKLARIFPSLLLLNWFKKLIVRNFNENALIKPGFYCVVGSNIKCDKNVNLNDTYILDYGEVIIGEGVKFFGKNLILTSAHRINDFDKIDVKPVIIEKNVCITYQCVILAGVRIGENSIIGAGSVVTKNIPPNVVAAGNPCKIVKYINEINDD